MPDKSNISRTESGKISENKQLYKKTDGKGKANGTQ